MFDYLIIGSGFTGAVMAERLASQFNKKVLVVEKRKLIMVTTTANQNWIYLK